MKIKILAILIALFLSQLINAQVSTQWVSRFNGPANNNDGASCITVDNHGANAMYLDKDGNVYITGYSTSKESSVDIVTIKYDVNGQVTWNARYNNPRNTVDYGSCLAVNEIGDVFVGGYSENEGTGLDY